MPQSRVVMTDIPQGIRFIHHFKGDAKITASTYFPDTVRALNPFEPQAWMSAVGRQLPQGFLHQFLFG